jgi:beta-mannosidase
MKFCGVLLFFAFVFCWENLFSSDTLHLDKGWNFNRAGMENWYPAIVPGSIHSDLFLNGLIEDPFIGDNEKKLQWIDSVDWIYKCEFFTDGNFKKPKLVFEGLDTYADIFLDGKYIFSVNNMFRSWEYSLSAFPSGKHELMIWFNPAKNHVGKLSYELPANERVFTRKAAFQYGWDFGPRFISRGIWKNIFIVDQNQLEVKNVQFITPGLNPKNASLKIKGLYQSIFDGEVQLKISDSTHSIDIERKLKVNANDSVFLLDIKIEKPEYWWPNGIGNQNLYKFTITIERNNDLLYSEKINYGFRKIELIQKRDSLGSSFYFKINDMPVFIKGANIVPPAHFVSSVSDSAWINLVNEAADQNMNMLRVWGGGIYPPSAFYKQCDRKGILVWQDFMFACAMYPGDSAFLENVKLEAKENIIKFRNHPSLALWCGNNENDEGWRNWGWQKQFHYSEKDSSEIYTNYKKLFENILPAIVLQNDSGRIYLPSSPLYGWGRKESMTSGDAHYWGVWWGREEFSKYKEKVPRFMSEYGFQSAPAIKTIQQYSGSEVIDTVSSGFKNHQKHPFGFEAIDEMIRKLYGEPKDFSSYVYLSQLVQAEAMKTAITSHRLLMPYCMGSLYWQLNDTWPGYSWSTIDYYGRKKAAHYWIKKLYRNIFLSADMKKGELIVYAVSDSPINFPALLEIKLLSFNGKTLLQQSKNVVISAGESNLIYRDLFPLPDVEPRNYFLLARLMKGEQIIGEDTYYFPGPDKLTPLRSEVTLKLTNDSNDFTFASNTLLRKVEFMYDGDSGIFSDNYFDVLPNESYEISIPSLKTLNKSLIQFRSLNDAIK